MFFESVDEIKRIATKTGAAIFVVPSWVEVKLPGAIVLQPENKTTITIEQVRTVIAQLIVRQTSDRYILVRPAELMNEEAANALLKNLEEPGEKVHFVLVTDAPSRLLSTIQSRCAVYFLRECDVLKGEVRASEKAKEMAKQLMVAKAEDLVTIAEEIAKKKDGARVYALEVVGAAIEMLYKTYFITEKPVYLAKLPKFLSLQRSLSENGHVKLQIVSNLC